MRQVTEEQLMEYITNLANPLAARQIDGFMSKVTKDTTNAIHNQFRQSTCSQTDRWLYDQGH